MTRPSTTFSCHGDFYSYFLHVPGCVICLLISLIPFGSPKSFSPAFSLLFNFLLPATYAFITDHFVCLNMKIKKNRLRTALIPLVCSVATLAVNEWLAEAYNRHPLPYSFCYFFVVQCTVHFLWWGLSMCYSWRQGKVRSILIN